MHKNLFLALTLAALVSNHASAGAEELTGTLAKVKELGTRKRGLVSDSELRELANG